MRVIVYATKVFDTCLVLKIKMASALVLVRYSMKSGTKRAALKFASIIGWHMKSLDLVKGGKCLLVILCSLSSHIICRRVNKLKVNIVIIYIYKTKHTI